MHALATTPAQAPAEASLIATARGGDQQAFHALYDAHVGRVYALCLRAVGDTTRAEQLTQDAFVRAWERLHQFRGDAAFSTWLHRLTVNLICDEHRRVTARRESPPEHAHHTATDAPGAPAREAGVDLERAIASLPDGARLALVLHDVEGLRHDEIAAQLGVSVGTSKSQLHRARRLVREMLS